MLHLFTYGTLMFPEVWQAVLGDLVVGQDFETVPATLSGYQIYRVKNAVYPGIVKSSAQPSAIGSLPAESALTSDLRPLTSVPGLLYLHLDDESLRRLDQFEDDFYVRQPITVTTETGEAIEAQAYVVPPDSAHLLTDEIWTATDFAAGGHLAEFVARYSGFNRLS